MSRSPTSGVWFDDRTVDGNGQTGGHTPVPGVGRARRGWVPAVVALAVVVAVPLVLALGVMREPRSYPLGDVAQTELRVRDVGSGDTPLTGLPGRLGSFFKPGSHPGPLSFWTLAPVYRMFGATSWALLVAAGTINLAAIGAVVWMAHRRAGPALALGAAALLSLLVPAYGFKPLVSAWNPDLPVLMWFVFLFAVWSVVCDDLATLPVLVFAGSFCMQTHVSYLGLVGGLGAFAIAAVAHSAYRQRADRDARRRFARWGAVAVVLGASVWSGPVLDQLTNEPGNLSVLFDHFTDPPEDPIGFRRGVDLLLVHLDPWRLVTWRPATVQGATAGSVVPGLVLLGAWGVAAVATLRWVRHSALLRLHLVVAVALVFGAVSAARIFGPVWYYLVMWGWGVNALMLLATGWTAASAIGGWLRGPMRQRAAAVGVAALAAVTVGSGGLLALDALDEDAPDAYLSRTLDRLIPPASDALDRGEVPGFGRDGRYLVTWTDPVTIDFAGFALLNELDGDGFDVGALETYRTLATPHRVVDPGEATGVVHLSVGSDVEEWRAMPGVEEVAYFDPRSRPEQRLYSRLRARVIADLVEAGLTGLVPSVDDNLLAATLDDRVPAATTERMARMLELGLPAAVFVGPPAAVS